MSNDESLSSKILSNVDIIADIYKIVKDSGLKATSSAEVKRVENSTTIIKANIPGVNRFSANCRRPGLNANTQCRTSNYYTIKYDANDMTIVGGASLNIYDYLLRELKGRRSISALEDYIKKRTSDIDVVWWPRSVTNPAGNSIDREIVTSTSPAIAKLVDEFIKQLIIHFEENKEMLQTKLKQIIPNSTDSDTLNIEVGGDFYTERKAYHNYKSGTYTVVIKFKIKSHEFKICEILVHDSGASQQFDENGLEIKDLRYMTTDPMFCSPVQSSPKAISYQNVNGFDIAVPNILAFVKQQMLAFSNLITNNKDREGKWNFKGFINFKRVVFIKILLQSIKTDDENNKGDLLEVFKTTNTSYPSSTVKDIESIEDKNIKRLYPKILELCENYNASSDPIISELCTKAENIVKIDESNVKWISDTTSELVKIRDRLHQKYKAGLNSSSRRAYSDLERTAEHNRFTVQGLTPNQVKNHPFYKENIIKQLLNQERNIDRDVEITQVAARARKEAAKQEAALKKAAAPSQNFRKDAQPAVISQNKRAALLPPPHSAISMKPTFSSVPFTMGHQGPLSPPPPPPPPRWPQPFPPVSAYSERSPSGVIVHYTPDNIPWYVTPTNQIVMKNPYTGLYEVIGQMVVVQPLQPPMARRDSSYYFPPPPPPPGSGYGGPPPGSGYGGPGSRRRGGDYEQPLETNRNNVTHKNRKRNNFTKKRL